MPLHKLQLEILRALAAHRSPDSYVAGSTPINRAAARYSADIDVFHDREEAVGRVADEDSGTLAAAGYEVEPLRAGIAFRSAIIRKDGASTKLEWVADSDYRFFPAIPDPDLGYTLHLADLATNKVMAAAGRREPRDIVDLLTIHDQAWPLGAVIWAAVGKALGFTPEGLVQEIRRLARYVAADFADMASDPPIDPAATMTRFRMVLNEAEEFVLAMPSEKAGLLFLLDGRLVQPDPAQLNAYVTHEGCRRGHWPDMPGLSSAMLAAQGIGVGRPYDSGERK